jgi:hypothetical protein
LINLGASINVMTKETMQNLMWNNLRQTTIVLQLVDLSTAQLEGILEDVVIYEDYLEYPTDFMVVQPKSKIGPTP